MNRRNVLGTMLATVMGGKQAVEQVGGEFASQIAKLGLRGGVAGTEDRNYPQTDKMPSVEDKAQMLLKRGQEKERLQKEAAGEFMGWKQDQLKGYEIIREYHDIEALKSVTPGFKFIMSRNLTAKRNEEQWKEEARKQLLNFDRFWGIDNILGS